jgi:hypothetical protein
MDQGREPWRDRRPRLLRAARTSPPAGNARLRVRGRWLQADLLWPDARVVVEVDGRRVHSIPEAFEADRRKDGDLRDAGFDVRHVTGARLRDDAEVLAAQLRRAIGRGRAHVAGAPLPVPVRLPAVAAPMVPAGWVE